MGRRDGLFPSQSPEYRELVTGMTRITLAKLAEKLAGRLEGDGQRLVDSTASLTTAGPEQVSFLANSHYERHMAGTSAGAVIVSEDYSGPRAEATALIRCKDAYFAFREAMVLFYGFRRPDFEGVDSRASVHPTARLDETAAIGPFAVVSAGCRIGPNTAIYPGAYIGAGCRVGRDCVIYPNVTLYDGTILHDRVTIHASSSIGHDGFGYATHADANGAAAHHKIPQAGWVEIGDDVEIGACCTIDRATMGATIIGAGTKFSNLIAIGHGTKLGKHCLMVAQAGIAGSVMVGDYCVFAGQCGVVGHITIGDGAKIGAKSGVIKDIPPGLEVLGSPAVARTDAKRAVIGAAQVPRLRDAVRKLAHDIRAIKLKLGIADDQTTSPRTAKDE